jgi:hypothetical protein
MKISKSTLFKSAHAIYKMQNVNFSEALTLAWSKVKQGVKAIVMKCNKQIKSERWIGYETVYFNELVFQSIVVSRTVCNNSGARHDYGIGAYNGD